MLCTVLNKARSARGFATLDRGVVMLEAGASALLDLADHALHRAWSSAGAVAITPLSDKDAKVARKRIDSEVDALERERSQALAGLPSAQPN